MEIKALKCPSCGADVEFKYDESKPFIFCQYCGTKIMLDDIHTEHRIVDEAKLKYLDYRQQRHEERLERHEKRHEERMKRREGLLSALGLKKD